MLYDIRKMNARATSGEHEIIENIIINNIIINDIHKYWEVMAD